MYCSTFNIRLIKTVRTTQALQRFNVMFIHWALANYNYWLKQKMCLDFSTDFSSAIEINFVISDGC